MRDEDHLNRIREKSVSLLAVELADGREINEVYLTQLDDFSELLFASIISQDPALDTHVLDDWLNFDFSGWNSSPLEVLNQFHLKILKTASEDLSADNLSDFIGDLLPVFSYASQYIHSHELDIHIADLSQDFNHKHSSLERLEKSKSDFISIAAHELKTPLTLMEGYSAMLRDILRQKKIFDEHIFLLIDGMDSGSRRLREIISDMIDVSLIDNDMLSLNLQPTWLYKVLERIFQEVEDVIELRQLSFRLHRFSGDDVLAYYDDERLFQALYNVISNAIKYTPDGGKINVDGRKLQDFIEIVIIDNGIGIDPMDQGIIFEKFQPIGDVAFHSSGKLKFKGGGPGLGLPIAKGIIEAHGGRIWAESEGYDENRCPGSTFHVLLPIRSEPPDDRTTILFEPLVEHKSDQES
jgi:signal transduction histidine kinase